MTSTEEDRPDTGLKTRGTLRKIEDSRKVSVFARAGKKPDLRGHKNIMSLGTERESGGKSGDLAIPRKNKSNHRLGLGRWLGS